MGVLLPATGIASPRAVQTWGGIREPRSDAPGDWNHPAPRSSPTRCSPPGCQPTATPRGGHVRRTNRGTGVRASAHAILGLADPCLALQEQRARHPQGRNTVIARGTARRGRSRTGHRTYPQAFLNAVSKAVRASGSGVAPWWTESERPKYSTQSGDAVIQVLLPMSTCWGRDNESTMRETNSTLAGENSLSPALSSSSVTCHATDARSDRRMRG